MRVFFNGSAITTQARNSKEFFENLSAALLDSSAKEYAKLDSSTSRNMDNEVWIVNGYATKEPIALGEGDVLFCIPKGVMPNKSALESMMCARHTPKVHNILKNSTIVICGLGGLGSHIAISLARSGVGHLRLIDFDIIEPSNLNRQAYAIDDLGAHKAHALAKHIAQINPFITTTPIIAKLMRANLKEHLQGADIVCEAFDGAQAKAMLASNFHAIFPHIPLICASGLAGFGNSNTISTREIAKNLYICGDMTSSAQVGRGLMAPRVMLCAAHQANLVLELLCKQANPNDQPSLNHKE